MQEFDSNSGSVMEEACQTKLDVGGASHVLLLEGVRKVAQACQHETLSEEPQILL